MRFGITAKLFVTIVATSVLIAIAVGAAARFNFSRGFLGYLNDQGVERMEGLLPALAAAYHEHGNWEFIRDNPRAWFHLLRPAAPESTSDPSSGTRPLVFPNSDLTGFGLRLALLDEQHRWVVGNTEVDNDALHRAVVVDGRAVGWLALIPIQHVTGAADLRFQQQQLTATWVIIGLAVLLAAGVAILLAHTMLSPIKRLAAATHQLAGGDYANRVEITSSDEIGSLAEDFNRLAHALDRNERMRRGFMADISHELRTPLAVLRAELEALEDGVRPLNADAVHGLQLGVETLNKLVDDLYELSLSDAGALTYRMGPVDLGALLQEMLRRFEERYAEKRILIDAAIPTPAPVVRGDHGRLRQLLSNLLENSARHTAEGGRLRISCHSQDGIAQIDFQDSTPGVPEALLPRLFERFYRVNDARTRDRSGAGLGLAICRNITEAHGGTIDARPSPLGGLWISLRLPLEAPT
ncbi:sensor histidine kinase efflux regulator BaeS [Sinimarinibacterium sp. CAU 1509]|uniref:sensor histidine kinase efflux regulator BaeS n=1 Tax=Sinimarinibacterium sp. CAU 1509 TaxID=2562283 RepID=UPI0010AD804F|nr:sensor histidine kinase efflux regulator BaeS [Sinimarinibacterium sp. CAU 1509]TJY62014.1 sensor histidine kinase efflux regulator BaeS [Sinimarinibacterium sp. CAU 1509]